jgi:hypothetical protein
MDIGMKHIGLIATPNPSPYVHFAHVTYPKQSSQEGLPETSVLQEEFQNLNDYNQPTTTSIRSMPNISLAQGKPFFNRQTYVLTQIVTHIKNLHPLIYISFFHRIIVINITS